MAPTNTYLVDDEARQRLAQHDRELIKGSTTFFPGDEEPEVHWDFNRSKEYALLITFLDSHDEADFISGVVTVEAAARATYGTVDEYLLARIATTHLNPSSGFNKASSNGQVAVLAPDGTHILRDDRMRVALETYQAGLDKFDSRLGKTLTSATRSLKVQERRARKIAPDADLKPLAAHTSGNAAAQIQLALGQGKD